MSGYVPRKLRDRSGVTRRSGSRGRDDRRSDAPKPSAKSTGSAKTAAKKARPSPAKPNSKSAPKRRPSPRGSAPQRPSPKARVPLAAYRRSFSVGELRRFSFFATIAALASLLFVGIMWVGSGASPLQMSGMFGRTVSEVDAAKKDTKTAASAMYSYDYRTFDDSVANGRAFTTDSFSKEYDKVMTGLSKPAVKEKAVVDAEVVDVATIESDATCSPKKGPAISGGIEFLVFLNQTVKNSNIEGSRVDKSRLVMCMVSTDSGWKAANTDAI